MNARICDLVTMTCFMSIVTVCLAQNPNIVIIYTDDQGYGDVSTLNPRAKFETPHMDRLAREGMIFTDAHTSSTVCTPSRYGLLTGRYSWRTSLKRGVLRADGDCLISDDRLTLASLLKQNGYQTALIGKWHLNMQFPGSKGKRNWSKPITDGPNRKGFDYYFGLAASMNYGLLTYIENDNVLEIPSMWTRKKIVQEAYRKETPESYRMMPPYDQQPLKDNDIEVAPSFRDDEVLLTFTNRAVGYINRVSDAAKKGNPFFLYMPLTSPHLPHAVHPDFAGRGSCGTYGAFMEETDYRIGQVLQALDANQLADNTLVIFTSDNGAETNYRDHIKVFQHHNNLYYRGGKRDLYEGGHRVPFIARWPGVIQAGTRCDELVCQTDLLATFSDMLNQELSDDAGEDSYSMLSFWKGETSLEPRRNHIIHQSGSGFFGYRKGDFKLLVTRSKGEPNYELYNLNIDSTEKTNLFGKYPEMEAEMLGDLTAHIRHGRSTPGEKQSNDGGNWWAQLIWLDE